MSRQLEILFTNNLPKKIYFCFVKTLVFVLSLETMKFLFIGLFASPGMPDYNSSKHAAVGLHNSVYFDLKNAGKNGIKTTLVCPYLITTGMFL